MGDGWEKGRVTTLWVVMQSQEGEAWAWVWWEDPRLLQRALGPGVLDASLARAGAKREEAVT